MGNYAAGANIYHIIVTGNTFHSSFNKKKKNVHFKISVNTGRVNSG